MQDGSVVDMILAIAPKMQERVLLDDAGASYDILIGDDAMAMSIAVVDTVGLYGSGSWQVEFTAHA